MGFGGQGLNGVWLQLIVQAQKSLHGHGQRWVNLKAFWHIADFQPIAMGHAAALAGFQLQQMAQQDRFPRPIGPNERNEIILGQIKRHMVQHQTSLTRGAEIIGGD